MLNARLTLIAGFALSFLSCNSSTNSSAGGGTGLTAKIDGKAWEASAGSIVAQTNFGVPGAVMILGSQTVDGKTSSITMTLYNVNGPGDFPMGVDVSVFGGIGLVGEGTGSGGNGESWITDNSGVAGIVTITAIGDGRIVGDFEFIASPGKSIPVWSTRKVTEGHFDLPLKGTLAALAEGAGSQVKCELNGVFYNAATVVASLTDFTGGPGLTISTVSSLQSINIILAGVTDTGTFTPLSNMSPQRIITAGLTGGDAATCCWDTDSSPVTGKVIITRFEPKRVQGTFTATLKAKAGKPATEDLVITNGSFNVGIP
jgi:hypothetical protein